MVALILVCSIAEAADGPSPAPDSPIETIVVEGKRLSVETLIDRKVYSVSSDPQSTFGTLSDVLTVIPSVDVDPDGIVSLRGDTHVLVLIDGKPSTQLSGQSAGDNLQSIPAKDIERIEVLTTPPAQFKAEGAAGVINIITRKNRADGVSGSVQASLGSSGRSVIGAGGSYKSGALAASLTAGYRQDSRHRSTQSEVLALDPTSHRWVDSKSHMDERIRREVPTLGISTDYALNDRQSISGSANWSNRGGLRTYSQLNESSTPPGVVTSSTRRLSSGHDPEIDFDQKLGFTQKLKSPGATLDFSLDRSTSSQHERYDYTNDSFIPPAPTFYNNLSFHEIRGTTAIGIDYALPLAQSRSLKLGYAFEQDDYELGNVGNTVDPVSGAQLLDPNLSNDFKYRQQINAAYASYQTSIGAWTWLGGLRSELTGTDARQLTNHSSTTGRYLKIYPSLHIDRALSDKSTLSFGASARVTRPDPESLDPYVDHEYTPNLRAGNPHLGPQYTQSFDIGYGFEGHDSYGLTGYYRRNRDTMTEVTEYLANGLSLTTKANLPKNDSAGLEFNASGRIVPKLTYSLSGNLFYSQIDASGLGISGLRSTTGLNGKVKLDYRPTSDDSGQINVIRTDKRLTPQGYVSAVTIVNLGYKHQLKSNLTAVMTVSDVFDGQRFRRFATSPTFTQEYQRTVQGRVLYLGLVFSFGAAKKDKQQSFEYDESGGGK